MQLAKIHHIPALVAVEFPHGFEAVPTLVNGRPIRYASVDNDGSVIAWSSLSAPVIEGGVWTLETDDLLQIGFAGEDDGREYPNAADSLRRITGDSLAHPRGDNKQ